MSGEGGVWSHQNLLTCHVGMDAEGCSFCGNGVRASYKVKHALNE